MQHLQAAGFSVESQTVENLDEVAARYKVPDSVRSCHTATVAGYVVEGHVPAAVIKRLNADVARAMQAADVRERVVQMDIEAIASTPAQCDAFLRAQIETWGSIVRASGAKAG